MVLDYGPFDSVIIKSERSIMVIDAEDSVQVSTGLNESGLYSIAEAILRSLIDDIEGFHRLQAGK